MNPNMPKTGEQIFCVKIIKGKLEVTQEGIVLDRDRYDLTSEEFTTTHGSRYNCKYFWPGGAPSFFNLASREGDSTFMYCTEAGKLGALDRLKSDYVRACIRAEEELQSRARKLHEYASLAQGVEL